LLDDSETQAINSNGIFLVVVSGVDGKEAMALDIFPGDKLAAIELEALGLRVEGIERSVVIFQCFICSVIKEGQVIKVDINTISEEFSGVSGIKHNLSISFADDQICLV